MKNLKAQLNRIIEERREANSGYGRLRNSRSGGRVMSQTETKVKHTPTPWIKQTVNGKETEAIQSFEYLRENMEGDYERTIVGQIKNPADRAFVLEAVNSYQKDKETIRELQESIRSARGWIATAVKDGDNDKLTIAISRLDAALAKSQERDGLKENYNEYKPN